MHLLFEPLPPITLPITATETRFPVHRIYCVGKNYAAHALEMGADPEREPPCFFFKPSDGVLLDGRLPYPPGTANLHYEGELVLAIGKGGTNIAVEEALDHVFGYALGLDMTRRDLQKACSQRGQPWDTGKGFEHCAPLSTITPATVCGHPERGAIQLWCNDELRQNADIGDMIWSPPEIISTLSRLFTLREGDLIYTGTPAGVGAVVAGDHVRLRIAGIGEMSVEIV